MRSGKGPESPQTEAGKRLSLLLEGHRSFVGLPDGCGQRDSVVVGDTTLELELWCNPRLAPTAMPSTGPEPANMWIAKIDGRPVGEQPIPPRDEIRSWGEGGWARLWQPPYAPAGFHHRGQALDALGRQLRWDLKAMMA